jgi:hypothetical protein
MTPGTRPVRGNATGAAPAASVAPWMETSNTRGNDNANDRKDGLSV